MQGGGPVGQETLFRIVNSGFEKLLQWQRSPEVMGPAQAGGHARHGNGKVADGIGTVFNFEQSYPRVRLPEHFVHVWRGCPGRPVAEDQRGSLTALIRHVDQHLAVAGYA